MKKYKVLEHRADLKIRAFGKTKKDLFLNMFLGMQESMKPELQSSEKEIKRKIKIKSIDLPALLVDFLSEILYLSETKKEVYEKIFFKKFSHSSKNSKQAEIEADLIGKKIKRREIQIKGVTYYDLDVSLKKDGTWEATVLFDV